MTYITNFHSVEKIIGDTLLQQSELEQGRIINGLSTRGVSLSKFITDNVLLSYDVLDSVIIFEITTADNNDINFTERDNNNIREGCMYEVKVIAYGNDSINLIKKLKARFESARVRNDLLQQGIYLIESSSSISVNDFINETIYPRTDWSFTIAYETEISLLDDEQPIDSYSDVEITTKSTL